MAGDWIKLRHDLPEDPAVLVMAGQLGIPRAHVVGCLVVVWGWADRQLEDGHAPSVTKAFLDELTRVPGFADAMAGAGWLNGNESGITFPNFERHMGESAKKRALAAIRKQKQRATVTEKSRSERDESVTREEERREEKKNTPPKPPPGRGGRSRSQLTREQIQEIEDEVNREHDTQH